MFPDINWADLKGQGAGLIVALVCLRLAWTLITTQLAAREKDLAWARKLCRRQSLILKKILTRLDGIDGKVAEQGNDIHQMREEIKHEHAARLPPEPGPVGPAGAEGSV